MNYFEKYNNEAELIANKKDLSIPWVCTQASWQNVKYYDEYADVLDVRVLEDGTIVDASQNGNTIAVIGNPLTFYDNKLQRYVAYFNNEWGTKSTQYCQIRVDQNPKLLKALTESHTFEAVMMLSEEGTIHNGNKKFFTFHEGGGCGFQVEKDGRLSHLIHTTNSVNSDYRIATTTETLMRGVYYHVAGVWDKENSKIKVYLNGELCSESIADGTFDFPVNTMSLFVGCDTMGGNQPETYTSGKYYISYAKIWGRALTDNEIKIKSIKANATKKNNSYYLISDGQDLVNFSKMVNSGRQNINAYLLNDIDMDGLLWTPIGETDDVGFKGIINGGGHKISNLVYNVESDVQYKGGGLVGTALPGAKFIDLVIDETCSFNAKIHYLGAFVGRTTLSSDYIYFIRCGTSAKLVNTSNTTNSACAGFIGNCNDNSKVYLDYCWVNSENIQGNIDVAVCLGWTGGEGTGSIIQNCWFYGNLNKYQDDAHYIARGAGVTIINTYANMGTQGQVNNITTALITSGELAYNMGGEWGQKIGIDKYPTFGAPFVHKINNKYMN